MLKSHADLIKWFCRSVTGFQMAYFGDREIIIGKRDAYQMQGNRCPDSEVGPSNYTYEPYALVVSAERPELAQFVQRRFYEYFSQLGNAETLFQKYFPGKQMSPALAYLYLLNGVMDQEAFARETVVFEPTGRWIDHVLRPGRSRPAVVSERAPAPPPQPQPVAPGVAQPVALSFGGPLRRPLP